MRSTWVNFNSYYNTFYNANQSYNRGYRQFENQVDRINPERPIRIHRAPVRTGRADFEDAIDRGSDLLFRFPDSRYVDDALFLIGRSYYFLENFFNAEQKFMELFSVTQNESLRQQAVIWRARVMLDLQQHNDAITYLDIQLNASDLDWGRRERAEAQLLLAQHLVKQRQYEDAGQLLFEALPNVRDRELRARGYFLHGQILELLGAYEAAFVAYDRVRRNNPVYQMIYFSELRKGIVMRKNGNYEEALHIFTRMGRNNNNFDNLSQINYQTGRTLQSMGRYQEARNMYRDVLYFSYRTPQRETIAKAHYGMAELYRFNFRNYALAAAHYDTSARNASNEDLLPVGFDARILSRSFNEFARLNEQASKMDSLMWLGSLPAAQYDSVVTVIRDRLRRQLERERRQQQRESGRIVTVDPGAITEAEEAGENGFLFHLNRTLVLQASQQFQARWNSRPLVDNWRRIEAVRQAVIAAEEDETLADEIVYVQEIDPIEFELDLSEVPRTRQARLTMNEDLARTRFELGNIFFISLNMPDSARTMYRRIIDRHSDTAIIPQAMYSLSELYFLQGDEENSRHWATLIAEKHPNTIFARRLSERFDLGIEAEVIELAPKEQKIRDYFDLLDALPTMSLEEQARRLFAFASADSLSDFAPDAYLSSAKAFIRLAQEEDETFNERSQFYTDLRVNYDRSKSKLQVMKDSSKVVLADTTLTEDLRAFWLGIQDSSITTPDFRAAFPFYGEFWDEARSSLEKIRTRFPRYARIRQVNTLYDQIKLLPEEKKPEPKEENTEKDDTTLALEHDTSQVYECSDLRMTPKVIGGLETFIFESEIQELLSEMGILQAMFSYRVTINHQGEPERVFSIDEEDEFGFQEYLLNMIQANMRFEPLIHNNKIISAICVIDIPVNVSKE